MSTIGNLKITMDAMRQYDQENAENLVQETQDDVSAWKLRVLNWAQRVIRSPKLLDVKEQAKGKNKGKRTIYDRVNEAQNRDDIEPIPVQPPKYYQNIVMGNYLPTLKGFYYPAESTDHQEALKLVGEFWNTSLAKQISDANTIDYSLDVTGLKIDTDEKNKLAGKEGHSRITKRADFFKNVQWIAEMKLDEISLRERKESREQRRLEKAQELALKRVSKSISKSSSTMAGAKKKRTKTSKKTVAAATPSSSSFASQLASVSRKNTKVGKEEEEEEEIKTTIKRKKRKRSVSRSKAAARSKSPPKKSAKKTAATPKKKKNNTSGAATPTTKKKTTAATKNKNKNKNIEEEMWDHIAKSGGDAAKFTARLKKLSKAKRESILNTYREAMKQLHVKIFAVFEKAQRGGYGYSFDLGDDPYTGLLNFAGHIMSMGKTLYTQTMDLNPESTFFNPNMFAMYFSGSSVGRTGALVHQKRDWAVDLLG